jgi:predicted DsbA family dithiol-disulfide isomerase
MVSNTKPVTIDVVSDVVCPWCFIGKRRLEKAVAQHPEIPVTIRWRPYFLNPWVPREGMRREDYLTAKFGSVDRYAGMAKRVAGAAAEEGLVYALDKIKRQPNTLDAHRLIRWADAVGGANRMKQRLMDIYFTEGGDLTDREVLVKAAAACGLDPEQTRARLASDADVAAVTKEAEEAKAAGIDGVPCFIFADMLAVSGAQAPDYLASMIARVAAEQARQSEEHSPASSA